MTPVRKTTRKTSAAKTAETVKTSTKKAADTVKTETKKAAEAVKEETKKVTAAVKEETKKVTDAVKEEPKKTTRRTAKKTAPQVKTYVEFFGKQISTQAIAEQIENQNSDKKIETLEIYVKPEENAAYYVINGEGSESFRIDL